MKLILISCDFINEKSKQTIIYNIHKDFSKCKARSISNKKCYN